MASDFKRAFRLNRSSERDERQAVDDELDFHLELCVEELVEAGWAPEEARREARRQFGDLEETRSYCTDMQTRRGRDERRVMSMDELMQDLRYAFRTLMSAPGYAGLVILTLAFGIAANTTIFSVMNPYFFRPLPFSEAEELVQIGQVDPVSGWHMDRTSLPIYDDWRSRSRGLEAVGAYTYGVANVTGPEGPERVNQGRVTANMFDVLDVDPLMGRTFVADDGSPAAEPVVILDQTFWERRYLAAPDILGRTIMLDGVAHTVVGVMNKDFTFPFGGIRVWVPIQESYATADRAQTYYFPVGRLADGWTVERLDDELTGIQAQLASIHPEVDGKWDGITVQPLRQALNFVWDIMRISFGILLSAVIFVLMIACVNVASLTLARASGRVREVAVRAALGARRGRLVRQLLTESFLLAVAGGALGIVLAYWATGIVGPAIPEDLYKIGEVSIDGRVLAFTLILTMATPLAFGLVPALTATRRSLTEALKEGAKGSGGMASSRGRKALVVTQVALAVVLITGAGLMLRSFASVQDLELGFDAERVLTVSVQPPRSDYADEELQLFATQAMEALGSVPGVRAVSASAFIPLNHENSVRQFSPPEAVGSLAGEWPAAVLNRTYPGYFETMGINMVSGQDFQLADDRDAPPVVIVNRTLAERYWPDVNPVGRTLLVGDPDAPLTATVVAVVDDVLHSELSASAPGPQLYRPALQATVRRHFFLLATDGRPADLIPAVREAMRRVDPTLPLGPRPLQDVVNENSLQWSIGSLFMAIFGGGALLLATLGIYGLISYSVAQRKRELGVRIALGATRSSIRGIVVGDGLRLTAMGIVAGGTVAVLAGKLFAEAFFGVSVLDPVTLAAVLFLFLGVSALASYVPARRASRTDPIGVLRED